MKGIWMKGFWIDIPVYGGFADKMYLKVKEIQSPFGSIADKRYLRISFNNLYFKVSVNHIDIVGSPYKPVEVLKINESMNGPPRFSQNEVRYFVSLGYLNWGPKLGYFF
jgi:hypothetical protein